MLIQHLLRVHNFCTAHISYYLSFHHKYTWLQCRCVAAAYALNCKYCNSSRWQEALELLLLWYRCLTVQPYGSNKAAFSEITKTTPGMQPCKYDLSPERMRTLALLWYKAHAVPADRTYEVLFQRNQVWYLHNFTNQILKQTLHLFLTFMKGVRYKLAGKMDKQPHANLTASSNLWSGWTTTVGEKLRFNHWDQAFLYTKICQSQKALNDGCGNCNVETWVLRNNLRSIRPWSRKERTMKWSIYNSAEYCQLWMMGKWQQIRLLNH